MGKQHFFCHIFSFICNFGP